MKAPLALLLGITGNMAFAAGCLLFALTRHSPGLRPDILIYIDNHLPEADARILRKFGARFILFEPPKYSFTEQAIRQFSCLSLARFEGFRLLDKYKTVLWLDVDIAIQDDITPLLSYGPLALALEDPCFSQTGLPTLAGINAHKPLPGLDPDQLNLNSGILVLQDTLPKPGHYYEKCLEMMRIFAPDLDYIDQGVLNMLVQEIRKSQPKLFELIPHDVYNAHPRNPGAWKAAVVHAFGAYKIWDDGLTICSFPEWQRDYARWLALGGTPWQGSIDNKEFLEGGAFFMLRRFYDSILSAQTLIDKLGQELGQERLARQKLQKVVQMLSERK